MLRQRSRAFIRQAQRPVVVRWKIRELNLADIVRLDLPVVHVGPRAIPGIEPSRTINAHQLRSSYQAFGAALFEICEKEFFVLRASGVSPTFVALHNMRLAGDNELIRNKIL